MSESKLLCYICKSTEHRNVMLNSLGMYLLLKLIQHKDGTFDLSEEIFRSFMECELSVFYRHSKINKLAYNSVSDWRDNYEIICNKIIKRIGENNFLAVKRESVVPDSVHYEFRSILWLIADKSKHPYSDPFAISFGLKILNVMSDSALYFAIGAPIEKYRKSSNYFVSQLGIGSSYVIPEFPNSCKEFQNLFLSFPLEKNIQIATHIILSRFPVIDTMQYIRQFLYEEFEGLKHVNEPSILVQRLLKQGKAFLRNTPNNEEVYSVDGPAGPQQALRLISGSFLGINADFSCLISCGVLENIYNIYQKNENVENFRMEEIFDRNIWNEIKDLSKEFEFLSKIIKGNIYRDMYEFAALSAQNKHLSRDVEAISEENSSLLTKNIELEQLIATHKEQLKQEKQSNEHLISETIKYLEELDAEKIKNSALQTENLGLQNQNTLLQYTISGLKKLYKKFSIEEINEALKFDLVQIFSKHKTLTVTACLKLIELLCGDRIVVHPDAYKSARAIDAIFVNCGRLLSQLCILSTSFYDVLQTDGEYEAKKCFTTNEYASSESETIRNSNSPEVWSDRTITYKGKPQKLLRHLKISSNFNSKFTIRTYFMFDDNNKKIIIGYCGKHPKNTLS